MQIGGATVFTGEQSQRGYRLNRMAMSLTDADSRRHFVADEDGYMRSMGLSAAEAEMVRRRDWKAMLESGGSIYLIIKIAGALGIGLPEVGAQTGGRTLAEWQAAHAAFKGH
jgi:protocatechuate 4,5-dioxygenase alpha subunit